MDVNYWLIADTHFFHGNIIKYCNRPFKDYKEMNEELIRRWNEKVAPTDVVFHLGDFSMGHYEKIMSIRARLNGTIFLIRGNHDREIIKQCGMFVIEGNLIVDNLILSHRPLQPEEIPEGYINVHGHIHHHESHHGVNVSVEKIGFTPIKLESIHNHKYL